MAAAEVSTCREHWAVCDAYELGTGPCPAGPAWRRYVWRKGLEEFVRSDVIKSRLNIVAQRWVELRGPRTVSFIYLQLSSEPCLFSSLPLWNFPRGSSLKHWRPFKVASGEWGSGVLQNSTGHLRPHVA